MTEYSIEQACHFEAVYESLKKAKADEEYLSKHREQIIAAQADGISDADLVRALKEAYPELRVSPTTIRKLRKKWVSEVDASTLRLAEA